jgi:hypothetical protein
MSAPTTGVYPSSNMPGVRVYTERQRKYSFSRTVNFKIILDSSEFRITPSLSKLSTLDKINLFLKSMPEAMEAINIFRSSNKYYLTYYSPKEQTFFVKQMEN